MPFLQTEIGQLFNAIKPTADFISLVNTSYFGLYSHFMRNSYFAQTYFPNVTDREIRFWESQFKSLQFADLHNIGHLSHQKVSLPYIQKFFSESAVYHIVSQDTITRFSKMKLDFTGVVRPRYKVMRSFHLTQSELAIVNQFMALYSEKVKKDYPHISIPDMLSLDLLCYIKKLNTELLAVDKIFDADLTATVQLAIPNSFGGREPFFHTSRKTNPFKRAVYLLDFVVNQIDLTCRHHYLKISFPDLFFNFIVYYLNHQIRHQELSNA